MVDRGRKDYVSGRQQMGEGGYGLEIFFMFIVIFWILVLFLEFSYYFELKGDIVWG